MVIDTAVTSADFIGELSQTLLALWRFPTFVGSRWLSVGTSARILCQGFATGYHHMYGKLRAAKQLSDYYCAGGDGLYKEHGVFALTLALIASVPESGLSMLIGDGRLLMQWTELTALLHDEEDYLETLGTEVWTMLAATVSVPAGVLRNNVLGGVRVSLAYISWRVLDPVMAMPWSLATGDLEENMNMLFDMNEPPEEPVASTLWQLHRCGMERSKLMSVLTAMQNASFTSYFTERQHSFVSSLMKKHDYGKESLAARAMLSTFRLHTHKYKRQLLPAGDPDGNVLKKLHRRRRALEEKRPQYFTGRQLYFQDMMRKSQLLNDRSGTERFSRHDVMARHGENWKHLPEAKQNEYQRRAKIARELKEQELVEDKTALKHAIDVQRKNLPQSAFRSMAISACKLNETERTILQNIHDSCTITAAHVSTSLRKGAGETMSEAEFATLVSRSLVQEPHPFHATRFQTQVAHARDYVKDAVFCLQDEHGSQHYYLFLYALCQPVTTFFIPLLELEGFAIQKTLPETKKEWREQQHLHSDYYWTYGALTFVDHAAIAGSDPCNIYFFPGVASHGGRVLSYAGSPVEWNTWIADLERERASSKTKTQTSRINRTKGTAESSRAEQALVDMTADGFEDWGPGPPSKRLKVHERQQDAVEDVDEEAVLAQTLWSEVEAARAYSPLLDEVVDEQFHTRLDAGAWQQQRTGRAVYGVRTFAKKNSLVHTFCLTFRLKQSQAFEINIYTEAGGATLARLWRHRMAFLARQWKDAECPQNWQTALENGWETPTDLEEQLRVMEGASRQRRDAIMKMLPTAI
eukprot:6492244-Amphidinium_carterae.1